MERDAGVKETVDLGATWAEFRETVVRVQKPELRAFDLHRERTVRRIRRTFKAESTRRILRARSPREDRAGVESTRRSRSPRGSERTPGSRALDTYRERAVRHVNGNLGVESARCLLRAHSPKGSRWTPESRALNPHREHTVR